MKFALLCTALSLLYAYSFSSPILHEKFGMTFVTDYLDRFYPVFNKSVIMTLQERIKKMQEFFHLAVTGRIDEATRKVMEMPRCGMPDILEARPTSPVWKKKALTYRINNYTPDLTKSKVDQIIQRALNVWSEVTPLTFTKVNGPADIEILFARRAHGDGNSFDGRGGVLAHAFFPGSGLGGDTHLDEDEKWSETNRDINLFLVIAHEFGHALGLEHSNVQGALMFPTYSYQNPNNFRLPDDDKQRIQRLYGELAVFEQELVCPHVGGNSLLKLTGHVTVQEITLTSIGSPSWKETIKKPLKSSINASREMTCIAFLPFSCLFLKAFCLTK